jgi:MerR family mercuric resistance operon transcriptional regulator
MPDKPASRLTIGRLAQAAGVGVETIRYYERLGLISQPPKPAHGQRTYAEKTIVQLRFIGQAKQCGFTLREIATLFSLGSDHCAVTRQLALQKLQDVEDKIAELIAVRDNLQALIGHCGEADGNGDCGLFATLLAASKSG